MSYQKIKCQKYQTASQQLEKYNPQNFIILWYHMQGLEDGKQVDLWNLHSETTTNTIGLLMFSITAQQVIILRGLGKARRTVTLMALKYSPPTC